MRGARGMDDEGLDVRDVCQQGEYREVVDELLGGVGVALYLKGEYRAGTVGEIPLIKRMAGVACKGGMMHRLHLRMSA